VAQDGRIPIVLSSKRKFVGRNRFIAPLRTNPEDEVDFESQPAQ
jgi:hypothetical protein